MGTVIVIMGVSGCGKTTIGKALAEATGGRFFDGDDFHSTANVEKMRSGIPLDDEDRRGWLEGLRDLIAKKSAAAGPTFLACSALKKSYRRILREGNESLRFLFLDGSEDLLRARMEARVDHYMPPELLQSQIRTLEPPDDAYRVDISTAGPHLIDELISGLGLSRSESA